MAKTDQDGRPWLERGSATLWLTGLSAALAAGAAVALQWTPLVAALIHVAGLSLITFALFWRDKRRSREAGQRRVPERVLLSVSLLGGAAGGMLAMARLRHKTKQPRFRILLPLFACLHAGALLWLTGWLG